ncbi:MAG: peptidylprolyl isomerase [Bacteroidaceae bacterium]|nr:peptidylprolyl isomerase [Bacteroidaceae bacterium]
MKRYLIGISVILSLLYITGCKGGRSSAAVEEIDGDTIILDADQFVRFETTMGTFTLKLYRETPLHRHNMVRQARKGFYDGQLFFGVQKNYKIQSGDINTKNARPGDILGNDDEPDTIQSEIQPAKFYHKRGAVGQASYHQFDYSTSQQFYIILGSVSAQKTLDAQENDINKRYRKAVKDSLTQPHAKEIRGWRADKNEKKITALNNQLNRQTDAIMAQRTAFKYSREQTEQYTKVGGAPKLDGFYTVFGEVYDGMEVVEAISQVHVDRNYRPDKDVKIIKAYVWEPETDAPAAPAQ